MRRLGIAYRKPLAAWINSHPPEIRCLEITAEHFFSDPFAIIPLRKHYDLLVHGLGLSLGTPGPLDQSYLQQFANVVSIADPLWISEHFAFTKTSDIDLGHLNPIPYTTETLEYFCDHALQVMETCGKPLLLENITTHLKINSPIAEPDFFNRVCDKVGCYILLDVTNLYVNSSNHGFSWKQWLTAIEPSFIKQLHIVGYTEQDGMLHDSHANNIQAELYDLTQQAIEVAGVDTIIIERDQNFPPISQLSKELTELEQCFYVN